MTCTRRGRDRSTAASGPMIGSTTRSPTLSPTCAALPSNGRSYVRRKLQRGQGMRRLTKASWTPSRKRFPADRAAGRRTITRGPEPCTGLTCAPASTGARLDDTPTHLLRNPMLINSLSRTASLLAVRRAGLAENRRPLFDSKNFPSSKYQRSRADYKRSNTRGTIRLFT